jgi:hypothetical protein
VTACPLKCITRQKDGTISGENTVRNTSSTPMIPGRKPWQKGTQNARVVLRMPTDTAGNEHLMPGLVFHRIIVGKNAFFPLRSPDVPKA